VEVDFHLETIQHTTHSKREKEKEWSVRGVEKNKKRMRRGGGRQDPC